MAAKRLKLKLSRAIPSFQLCRSKNVISSFAQPAKIYRPSPLNPNVKYFPAKSTPDTPFPVNRLPPPLRRKVLADVVVGEESYEDETETESLLFNSRSFSFDSSMEFFCNAVDINKKSGSGGGIVTPEHDQIKKIRSQRRRRLSASTEIPSPVRASLLKRMVVKDSVAVVKKSEDPLDDFKRSMSEMIIERQMFEAEELEELLQCFLSLNSRQYHQVIVEAFSEIWEILFCE